MCLAVPGRIISVFLENGLRMGEIDYDGVKKTACLEYVPGATTGDFVVVHAGFAIQLLNEEQAGKTLQWLRGEGENPGIKEKDAQS